MTQPSTQPPIRVALADDHRLVRQGIAALLAAEPGIEVVAEASRAAALYAAVKADPPDVAVLDIAMPGADGFDLAETLRGAHPGIGIVFLTSRKDAAAVRRALALGGCGYVVKDDAFEDLARAIREVRDGRSFASAGAAPLLASEPSRDRLGTLAPREVEVLRLIARGRQNKEIAGDLGISVNTVRTHRARLMEKLGIRSGPELVRYAMDRGIG